MKVYGIIMEINPFHNGHQYFLKQVRKIAKDNIVVCVVSTNVVERGEFSTLNKHVKTSLLLENGVDIVCELPTVLANQGGEYFALHSLTILSQFKITDLIFGSESDNLDFLIKQSEQISPSDFQTGIHAQLDTLQSNDILGISYLKAIKQLNLNIETHLVKRIDNNYNQSSTSGAISSATAIRANYGLSNISGLLPAQSLDNYLEVNQTMLFNLFKVNLANAIDLDINIFLSENKQLLAKLQRNIKDANSIEQLVNLSCDKNNSKSKLKRIIINTILLIPQENFDSGKYVRVLGFNKGASKYLPENCFTSLADNKSNIALIEARSAQLFTILTNNFLFNEFDRKPIIKE